MSSVAHLAPRSRSLAEELAALPPHQRQLEMMRFTPDDLRELLYDWSFWARPAQMEPPGEWWSVWLILAGRGFGKTRSGAEWIRSQVCGRTPMAPGRASRVALVAETAADARDVMVRGPAGILATSPPDFRPVYTESKRRLEWPNGAVALTFSAEDPEQLRGPEHDLAWSDELAKWRYAQETWDMLQFGLRIGDNPRQLVTTTPKPIPLVRELLKSADTIVTRGSTFDNSANLAPKFLRKMRDRYEGTRLGRQELAAEVLDDVPGALWTRQMLEKRSSENPLGARMALDERLPQLVRIVVAVDPSGSSGEDEDSGDPIGIIGAGLGDDGRVYVLRDSTCSLGPAGWARRVVQTYEDLEADIVVGEANFGGAMVEHTIRTQSRRIPYRSVHASRGKAVRAEPVAALYEQGRIRHYGAFPGLEDELCSFTRTGYEGKGSPNRADALVWAVTELMFGKSKGGGQGAVGGAH